VSEKQFVKALEHMLNDGKYELAASVLESCGDRFAKQHTLCAKPRASLI
jgi:hypothetical protein